jgi:tRNA nucleotidyltransferase (CCA-adding enzyme)
MSALGSIDFALVPRTVVELCQKLRAAGFEAYLVGGGVRDLVLKRPVHDWDVTTSARPPEVQGLFLRSVPTGIAHGTVTVLLDDLDVQVTTFRGESGYSDARHPDQVVFLDSIEADLSRRDFTINAMALDPVARVLVDPFGGSDDLERREVRAVGDAAARFAEDGLRCMRALRFAAVLEFAVDPPTLAAIPPALPRFRQVSAERVRDEMLKLLAARRPSTAIELMWTSGLLAEVLPELVAAVGLAQNRFHVEDVYQHSLAVCDRVRPDPILRLAALLHDVGKPVTAAPHATREGENAFHRHEQVGAEICDGIARRLRLSNEQRERLCHLVAHHLIQTGGWTAPGLRRFLRRVGVDALDDLFELRAADLEGRPEAEQRLVELRRVREHLEEIRNERAPLQVSDLAIGGAEVMERLGIPPGRQVGEILRALMERVLEDPSLNEPEKLLAIVDETDQPKKH